MNIDREDTKDYVHLKKACRMGKNEEVKEKKKTQETRNTSKDARSDKNAGFRMIVMSSSETNQ